MTAQRHQEDTKVFIVDAGPAGLTCAIDLAQRGVSVVVVDQLAGPRPESRALAIWPRTLDILAALDCLDATDLQERQLDHVSYDFGRGRSYAIGLPSAHRPVILPQPELEEMLHAAARRWGVSISWRCQVTGMHENDGSVTVDLTSSDENQSSIRCQYVVGADGASSTARKMLGIEYAGRTVPDSFYLADCTLTGLPPQLGFQNYVYSSGYAAICPLPDGRHRLFARLRSAQSTDSLTPKRVLQSLGFTNVEVTATFWTSTFNIHERISQRFRQERVFLIGDAAHTHSPAGGQGIQTGIGDAHNLAWKLAAVLNSHAHPRLLDTYESERMSVARATIARSAANTRMWDSTAGIKRVIVQGAFRLAYRLRIFQKRVVPKMTGYADAYPPFGIADQSPRLRPINRHRQYLLAETPQRTGADRSALRVVMIGRWSNSSVDQLQSQLRGAGVVDPRPVVSVAYTQIRRRQILCLRPDGYVICRSRTVAGFIQQIDQLARILSPTSISKGSSDENTGYQREGRYSDLPSVAHRGTTARR